MASRPRSTPGQQDTPRQYEAPPPPLPPPSPQATAMGRLLQFGGAEEERGFAVHYAGQRASYDVSASLTLCLSRLALFLKLVKRMGAGPGYPTSDWLITAVVAGACMLPGAATLALRERSGAGGRRLARVRVPLLAAVRVLRLSVFVVWAADMRGRGSCDQLRGIALNCLFECLLTPLFLQLPMVQHVPLQAMALVLSSWMLAKRGGVCDLLSAPPAAVTPACSFLMETAQGVAWVAHVHLMVCSAITGAALLTGDEFYPPRDPCRVLGLAALLLASACCTAVLYRSEYRMRQQFLHSRPDCPPPAAPSLRGGAARGTSSSGGRGGAESSEQSAAGGDLRQRLAPAAGRLAIVMALYWLVLVQWTNGVADGGDLAAAAGAEPSMQCSAPSD